ncbi:hypothetical protein ACNQGE_02040 [Flavobacterium sp. XS1P27]
MNKNQLVTATTTDLGIRLNLKIGFVFGRFGKSSSQSVLSKRQFWQQDNHPIEIWSLKVFEQKLDYIRYNPVESGFVTDPIDWKYSSTRNYGNNDQTILEIDLN